jgi:hypothetical protein
MASAAIWRATDSEHYASERERELRETGGAAAGWAGDKLLRDYGLTEGKRARWSGTTPTAAAGSTS